MVASSFATATFHPTFGMSRGSDAAVLADTALNFAFTKDDLARIQIPLLILAI